MFVKDEGMILKQAQI